MRINGFQYQTIWVDPADKAIIKVIDQERLPFEFKITSFRTYEDVYWAIRNMTVRGAPLIGVTGAFGIYLCLLDYNGKKWKDHLKASSDYLKSARPTAVNLPLLVDQMLEMLLSCSSLEEAVNMAFSEAVNLKEREIRYSEAIGDYGCNLIEEISRKKRGEIVNILTHCNAGWLACIDWGTATAPIYKAFLKGIRLHVWVDETRPRNQGARLTAWELSQEGVPHTVITDNTGGHLMQHGMVDLCIVGSDRTTATGDVANKIGTYLKALAAFDNNVPFYVALPSSSIDFALRDGIKEIPIEERSPEEIQWIEGLNQKGDIEKVKIIPEESPAVNYGFDVTPSRLITGLITERGICKAKEENILSLFPEKKLILNKNSV